MAPDRVSTWRLFVTIFESARANQLAHEIAHRDVAEREEMARIRLLRTDVFSELATHDDPSSREISNARAYTEWTTAVDNLRATMREVDNAVAVALQNVQTAWNTLTPQEQRDNYE